jgi:hypothetical protein
VTEERGNAAKGIKVDHALFKQALNERKQEYMVAHNSAEGRLKRKAVKAKPGASDPWSALIDFLHPH